MVLVCYNQVMKYLKNEEEKEAQFWIEKAVEIAKSATCQRSKCGSIIVLDNSILGQGYNSPPLEKESQRKCSCDKKSYHQKVTDKTCCVHAEQRAIMNALQNSKNLEGSRLYFIRLGEDNTILCAGKPYCTICSKMALDTGVREFVLVHEHGICVYDTEEYNLLSYQYEE